MSVEPILSEREREILELVATGASNKEIAQRLVISPNTVKVHLRNIFSKIGVVSRTEATLYALRENVIQHVVSPAGTGEGGGVPAEPPIPWYQQLGFRITAAAAGIIVLATVIFFAAGGGRILYLPTPAPVGFTQPERWSVLSNLPHALEGMAAVQYENSIYLIGGQEQGVVSSAMLLYDATNDTWSSQAEKPTPVHDISAGVIGEKIYVPGGVGSDGHLVDTVEVYNPRSNEWTQAAHLPQPLSDYALAAFEGRLFLFGGWDGTQYIDRVLEYDPVVDQWSERKPMEKAIGGAAAVVSGGKIYLIGGNDGSNYSNELHVYFPNREAAGELAWESRKVLPEPLVGSSAAALVSGLYTIGGSSTSEDNSYKVFRYDEQTDSWTALENPPVELGAQAVLVALDTKIHILGGNVGGAAQPTHLAYQAVYTVLIPAVSK